MILLKALQQEFIKFPELLRKDFDEKGTDWENTTLEQWQQLLEGLLSGKGTLPVLFNIPNNPNYGNDGKASSNIGQ